MPTVKDKISKKINCPLCGTPVRVVSDCGEGTNHYEPIIKESGDQLRIKIMGLKEKKIERADLNDNTKNEEVVRKRNSYSRGYNQALRDVKSILAGGKE